MAILVGVGPTRVSQIGSNAARRRFAMYPKKRMRTNPRGSSAAKSGAGTPQPTRSSVSAGSHGHNPSSGTSLCRPKAQPVCDWIWQRDACSVPGNSAHDSLRQRAVLHRQPIGVDEGSAKRNGKLSYPQGDCRSPGRHSLPSPICSFEAGDKFAAEHAAEHATWKEESIPCTYPGFVVRRQTACRNHAVNVWMMEQVLTPGMKDAEKADFSSQVFRIGGNLQESCGAGSKQKCVNQFLVMKRQEKKVCGES